MTTRMLIDATHAEETRIVVVDGKKLLDFDFETATKLQLKGNIYLAKVTRVEPSLQAAFVDYGGNRHGFLSFNEIHPDYYQIPVADRQALLQDEAEQAARQAALEDRVDENGDGDRGDQGDQDDDDGQPEHTAESPDDANGTDVDGIPAEDSDASVSDETAAAFDEAGVEASADDSASEDAVAEGADESSADVSADEATADGDGDDAPEAAQEVGAVDAMDEVPRPRSRSRRSYKIQEVIKRRQILLIQVVKEERGNKGAALTTYLSLAGRYCVLMPNTARGGGISRKIANQTARRKLKDIVSDLDVPQGMGVIVRTAGQSRTKSEIRRDFEYLLRLWDSVRDLTLDSTAPAVVYEEADLIKRAIRDMYAKDIDEILVDGEAGYRVAKDFMRMLMPSHAKKVQPYRDRIPLLHRYQVEQQLDSMHSNVVQLKSGGYLVFAQTEALVAVDVNSGRSTKERNIEETALKTNLEAASEVGRQLRLRDLAGLVVIDYIDMDENRNNRAVERRMKDALKDDRARIQVGRISSFGLMELSRQRLRPSLFEASTKICEICAGSGFVRTTESTALHVLRAIEEEGIRGRAAQLTVHAPAEVALYMLNQKRDHLAEIEQRYGMGVHVLGDNELVAPDCRVTIDRTRTAEEIEEIEAERRRSAAQLSVPDDDEDAVAADEAAAAAEVTDSQDEEGDDGEKTKERRPRRRRRSRRRGKPEDDGDGTQAEAGTSADPDQVANSEVSEDAEAAESAETDAPKAASEDGAEDEEKPRRRRRGRRGGRRRRTSEELAEGSTEGLSETAAMPSEEGSATSSAESDAEAASVTSGVASGAPSAPAVPVAPIGFTTAGITGAAPASAADTVEPIAKPVADPVAVAEPTVEAPAAPITVTVAEPVIEPVVVTAPEPAAEPTAEPAAAEVAASADPDKPKRRGWWQRAKLF